MTPTRRWATCLIAALAAFVVHLAHAQTAAAVGYVGWWQPEGWRSITHLQLQRLYFFDIGITDSGELGDRHGWPEHWGELQQLASDRNIPVEVCLTLMDNDVFHRVFSNPRAVVRLLQQAVELVNHPQVAGLHLDIEIYTALDKADIAAYRNFLSALKDALARLEPVKTVSVFLPFQSKDLLYDPASLQGIHHVVVQGYDAHWLESKTAGPVAPLDGPYALTWKKAVAYADSLGVPRSQQFMSYPLYGYEWKVVSSNMAHAATQGKGTITTFSPPKNASPVTPASVNVMERVARYGATFDPVSASSYYRFQALDGQRWEGWFDDWWGLHKKSAYLSSSHLGGMAFFLLGYDNGLLIEHYLQPSNNRKVPN